MVILHPHLSLSNSPFSGSLGESEPHLSRSLTVAILVTDSISSSALARALHPLPPLILHLLGDCFSLLSNSFGQYVIGGHISSASIGGGGCGAFTLHPLSPILYLMSGLHLLVLLPRLNFRIGIFEQIRTIFSIVTGLA